MSHKHCCPRPMPVAPIAAGPVAGLGGGCSNIFSLIILILVVLQFSRRRGLLGRRECGEGILAGTEDRDEGLIDNGILFIITIFLLIWCTCGRGIFGGCGGVGGFGGVGGYGGMY